MKDIPTVEDAGKIAVMLSGDMDVSEQAFFVAGFQEAIKHITQIKENKTELENAVSLLNKLRKKAYELFTYTCSHVEKLPMGKNTGVEEECCIEDQTFTYRLYESCDTGRRYIRVSVYTFEFLLQPMDELKEKEKITVT